MPLSDDDFSDVERRFLRRHGFKPEDVYDARYMSKDSWQRAAREEGKHVVLGSRCRAAGHRLRTRAGHCAQCDSRKIAYQLRFSSSQYVYIAGSLAGRVVKIGSALDVFQRENQLRAERYGGHRDWEVIYHAYVDEAGKIEHHARAALRHCQMSGAYYKDGLVQGADELLNCSFSVALKTLSDAIGGSGKSRVWIWHRWGDYEF